MRITAVRGQANDIWNYTSEVPIFQIRLVVLLVTTAVCVVLDSLWPRAKEIYHVMSYAAFVAVSILAAQWLLLAGVYLALTLAWAISVYLKAGGPWRTRLQLAVAFLMRNQVHLEALTPWMILVFVWLPWPALRIPAAVLLHCFGPPMIDGIGEVKGITGRQAFYDPAALAKFDWKFHWAGGRLGPALATSGLVWMWWQAPGQWRALAPFSAVMLGAILVRQATAWRLRPIAPPPAVDPRDVLAARTMTIVVYVLMVMAVGAGVYFSQGHPSAAERREEQSWPSQALTAPDNRIAALFLVSDTQFHELRGERTGGQLDLIDELVPVAVRPVELDLLSGASLAQFALLYHELQQNHKDLPWAHLGDYADLSCRIELERFRLYAGLFGREHLAALGTGNHDSTFVGNFIWHPDWKRACLPSTPLFKPESDQILAELNHAQPSRHLLPKTWLSPVRPLAGGRVLGAFLDSSDYTGLSLGVAGAQGGISLRQMSDVLERLGGSQPMVLFLHHPFDTLSGQGRWVVRRLAERLGDRLLALVSAHTHQVGERSHHFGDRKVVELVVGSTTDPPQEAALLEIFHAAGRYQVSLQTIPAVSRSPESDPHGFEPGAPAGRVTGADCRRVFQQMKTRDQCRDLFKAHPGESNDGDLRERLRQNQQSRARRLLACLGDTGVGEQPLDDPQLWDKLDRRILRAFQAGGSVEDRQQLVCLSWAGSVLQGHKRDGWAFADALRYALEDSVAHSTQRIIR